MSDDEQSTSREPRDSATPASGEQPHAAETSQQPPAADAPQQPAPDARQQQPAPDAPQQQAPGAPQQPAPDAQQQAPQPAPPQQMATQPTMPLPGPYAGPAPHPYGAQPVTGPQAGPHAGASAGPHPFGAPAATQVTPERRRRTSPAPLVAALVVGALVGGASGAGVTALALNSDGDRSTVSSTGTSPTTINVNDPDDATRVTAAIATAQPSTVTVYVSAGQSGGSGSGVVLDDEGHILTNSHVVTLDGAAGNPTVRVETADGRLLDARVVGTDPIADLAVIQVDATDLQPAEFASSADLNVGDTTIALGAPLGLANSASSGIISALNRSITVGSSEVPEDQPDQQQDGQGGGQSPFDFWLPGEPQQQASSTISLAVIQTDAAINHGNSGGALVDDQGRVIGINVAIASAGSGSSSDESGSIGVGFAIPSDVAQRVAREIIDTGSATHGLLGASVTDAASATGQPQTDGDVVGAVVQELVGGGAADRAGLRVGDVITSFNGVPITSSTDLTAQVRALAGGADADVSYVRGGDASTTSVTLGTFGA